MNEFSLSSALMHFTRTEGPSGFVWKFIASYAAALLALWTVWGAMMVFLIPGFWDEVMTTGGFYTDSGSEIVVMFSGFILYLGVASMFEAAALRRYIQRDGLSLRFGADERRVLLTYLIWFVLFFVTNTVLGLGGALIVGIISFGTGSPGVTVTAMVLLYLAFLGAMAFLGIKYSPATAISIRDQKRKFFDAAKAVKGRAWKLFGGFLLVYVAFWISTLILMLVAQLVVSLALNLGDDGALISGGAMLIVSALVLSVAFATFHLAILGLPAHAALTEPGYSDTERVSDIFG